jgi:hypothetical protein
MKEVPLCDRRAERVRRSTTRVDHRSFTAPGRSHERKVFANAQRRIDIRIITNEDHAATPFGAAGIAVEQHGSARGDEPGEHLEQRCFSGSVGSDDGGDARRRDLDGYRVKEDAGAGAHADSARIENAAHTVFVSDFASKVARAFTPPVARGKQARTRAYIFRPAHH